MFFFFILKKLSLKIFFFHRIITGHKLHKNILEIFLFLLLLYLHKLKHDRMFQFCVTPIKPIRTHRTFSLYKYYKSDSKS